MTGSGRSSEGFLEATEPVAEQLSKGTVLMSAFEVPGDFVPAPDLARAPHVLSTLVERSDREERSRLLVFWTDRDSFTAGAQAFRKRAGLPADAEVEVSWVTEIVAPKVPWFKRFKPYAVVLAIAGFLGGLEAIHNRYGLFFGSSEAVVRFDQPSTLNVQAGQPAHLKIVTQNNSRVVATRGTIEEISVHEASTSRQLELEPRPTFGPIKPGDSVEILVPIGKLGSDSSSIGVVARMEAGLLRPVQEVVLSREVEVWPAWSIAPHEIISQEPTEAWLRGELATGDFFDGLDCSIDLSEAATVAFQTIIMDGVFGYKANTIRTTPGSEFTQIRWRTPPLEAFSRQTYKLLLTADEPVSWPEVAQRLVPRCQPSRKGPT